VWNWQLGGAWLPKWRGLYLRSRGHGKTGLDSICGGRAANGVGRGRPEPG